MPIKLLTVLSGLALAGCGSGDLSEDFLGQYSTSLTWTLTVGGQSLTQVKEAAPSIVRGARAGTLSVLLNGNPQCALPGTPTSDTIFRIDGPFTCPPAVDTSCQLTLTITDGRGSLVSGAFSLSLGGTMVGTCTDGSGSYTGTFAMAETGTKTAGGTTPGQ